MEKQCVGAAWSRPSIPEGWEFDESSFQHLSPGMGAMVTTGVGENAGSVWTTYLAFNSIQEAYQAYQFIKQKGIAAYAEVRSPAKWLSCKVELKIWKLSDEWFNKFADATQGVGSPDQGASREEA